MNEQRRPPPPYNPNAEVRRAAEINSSLAKSIARGYAARYGHNTCDIEVSPDGEILGVRPR